MTSLLFSFTFYLISGINVGIVIAATTPITPMTISTSASVNPVLRLITRVSGVKIPERVDFKLLCPPPQAKTLTSQGF